MFLSLWCKVSESEERSFAQKIQVLPEKRTNAALHCLAVQGKSVRMKNTVELACFLGQW